MLSLAMSDVCLLLIVTVVRSGRGGTLLKAGREEEIHKR